MNYFTAPQNQETAFSVSQLNRQIQQLLEASLPWVLVEGEISNLARPGSGHWYFSLKDDKAQIRCAMFRTRNQTVRFRPKDGDKVRLRARVTFYGPRGDCQLAVESMESAGEGALQQAFERLKYQLQQEGLFDAAHKKALPPVPEKVALITSPVGAVVRDMITTFGRRFPLTELILFPTLVQGQEAAVNLVRQLQRADYSGQFDAIIIGRGGGSLEDLWSFNDEHLARAIFHCQTPIISAVGHETDFTIADFVADIRAPTPTAAAEMLSPDSQALLKDLKAQQRKLAQLMERGLQQHQQRLDFLIRRLRHPSEKIQQQQTTLTQLDNRLRKAMNLHLEQHQQRLNYLNERMHRSSPEKRVVQLREQQQQLDLRLRKAIEQLLAKKQTRFANLVEKLHLVSPLQTLSRGYSIASKQDQIVSSTEQVAIGDRLSLRVTDGQLTCEVTDVLATSDSL